jgi:GNAT superfamily N-acetyltransferase
MKPPLDNIIWHTLSGSHAQYSIGTATARRYAPGFSPIIGFAEPDRPDFDALAPFCNAGEHFYCENRPGAASGGWHVEAEAAMIQMVWEGALPGVDEAAEAIALGARHAAHALELIARTNPGPFGPRTIELGEYFGCLEGGQLVAMAGERMQAGALHEISGVCTHPDHRGRGHARRLMTRLIRRQMLRNETPFLHVMHDNADARRLYERMGFRTHRETTVRVVSRT